ncbi:MAG TPA: ribbon-helix-helix protein, CopG family [Solirubrobacterales bacterium]|nr:ribbon-helix-helix protein, CopG family [Solirubrobacterales bacterium]
MPKRIGPIKAVSLRLPDELGADVALVARADGVPISEVMRLAAEQYVARRREDEEFQERLADFLEKDRKAAERLSRTAG